MIVLPTIEASQDTSGLLCLSDIDTMQYPVW